VAIAGAPFPPRCCRLLPWGNRRSNYSTASLWTHVRDGAVVECQVGFTNLPTATLVAELDLMHYPEVEHVDIKAARLRRTSALVIERRRVVARVGRRRAPG
jgi:hypothetical protein